MAIRRIPLSRTRNGKAPVPEEEPPETPLPKQPSRRGPSPPVQMTDTPPSIPTPPLCPAPSAGSLLHSPLRRHWQKAKWLLQRHLTRRETIVAEAIPFGLSFEGLREDHVPRHIYCKGSFEPELTSFLLSSVRLGEGDAALDVGANIGWYTVLLSRLAVGDSRIVAFEPDPELFHLLEANLVRNDADRVTAVNAALGHGTGDLTLHVGPPRNRGRNSLLPLHSGRKVVVSVFRLADYWRTHLRGRHLRFLKIDVEGYEGFVLEGAESLVERCDTLMLEYTPRFLRRAGLDPSELVDRLLAGGLRPFIWEAGRLAPAGRARLRGTTEQLDLIWRRRG